MKYEKYKDLYTQFLISEKNLSKNSVNNYLVDLDQFFNNEDIKVVINPTIRGKIVKLDNTLKEKMNSDNAAKEMAGIPLSLIHI